MSQSIHLCSFCSNAPCGSSRQRYCSEPCRAAAARERAAKWYAEHRGDEQLKARVAESTRRHYLKVKADAEAWAARLAKASEWREANPEKMLAQNRAWCAANRDRKRAKDHRRRARLLAAYVEEVDPGLVWERDAGVCGICGEPVDPDLSWPNRRFGTIDHIIPLARGGTHEYANVQLAHMVCNARKNDRVAT